MVELLLHQEYARDGKIFHAEARRSWRRKEINKSSLW
jgi:hypothetical protein